MPFSAPRACATCGGVGCREHVRKPWQKRPDAPQRMSGRKWRELRAYVLQRDCGICQCDRCQGGKLRLRPANEVHHVRGIAEAGTDDPANLIAVNSDCHERLTMAAKGHERRPRIGVTGWPIE